MQTWANSMDRLSFYAEWTLGEPVTDDLLRRVSAAWPQTDESFCSGVANDDPTVLGLSFDLDVPGDDYDGAFATARRSIEAMAEKLRLPGYLRPMKGYTETELFTESPPGDHPASN